MTIDGEFIGKFVALYGFGLLAVTLAASSLMWGLRRAMRELDKNKIFYVLTPVIPVLTAGALAAPLGVEPFFPADSTWYARLLLGLGTAAVWSMVFGSSKRGAGVLAGQLPTRAELADLRAQTGGTIPPPDDTEPPPASGEIPNK